MADWKQITARIRRARTGKDPVGQLANLYQKTSDAMVAFELAKVFESSGQNSDAAKWYSTAATKFRRAEWKNKAQEAATRLGGGSAEEVAEGSAPPDGEFHLVPPEPAPEEKELPFEKNPEALESAVAVTSEIQEATKEEANGPLEKAGSRRRRGCGGSSGRILRRAGIARPCRSQSPRGTIGRTGAEPQGPLRRSGAFFANHVARNAISTLARLSSRKAERGGPRSGGTRRICSHRFRPDHLLLCGSLPDTPDCGRQSNTRRQPPRRRRHQATARGTPGNP